MKIHLHFLAAFLLSLLPLAGATPPPEQLLGKDTLFAMTVPDASKASRIMSQWPAKKFWDDPAMKPFRDKLTTKFKTDVMEPLEKELGIRFADYKDLASGQITLSIQPNGWAGDPEKSPSFLFLLDAGKKSAALAKSMEDLKTKWQEGGKPLRAETIRGVEFNALTFGSGDLAKTLNKALAEGGEDGGEAQAEDETKIEWLVGRADSLLIVGDSPAEIEKLLARKSGATLPTLKENQLYAGDHARLFRKSMAYGWVNLQSIIDTVAGQMSREDKESPPANELFAAPKPAAIMKALGLAALKSAAFSVEEIPQGTFVKSSVQAPENLRKGLLDVFKLERKDASPLPFVPEDAIKFSRTRLDLPAALDTLEKTVGELSPPMAGIIQLVIANAGKDGDPNFDLRKNLIANLGDDIITFQKAPREKSLESINAPPSLLLISSPRPEQLAAALKALTSLMPSDGGKIREREFLGRTIYSINLPPTMSLDQKPISRKLSYTASGGYVALTTDTSVLEEFLRNTSDKPLRETRGLRQAAEKVGGMDKGLFGYENDKVTVGLALETLKKESGTLANLFSAGGLGSQFPNAGGEDAKLEDWLDFSLLPAFEKVAKYFNFTVYSGGLDARGFHFNLYSPNPPNLD